MKRVFAKPGRNSAGRQPFSLAEVMIVLLIIGLAMAVVTPAILSQFDKAKQRTAKTQIGSLDQTVKLYFMDVDALPGSLADLVTDTGQAKWKGPYLDDGILPKDPWGNDYVYEAPGREGRRFDIYTYGADGAPGGDKYDADIYKHTEL